MTAAAPPPLAGDLADGRCRLKLAAIRRQAPEVMAVAKAQRWAPEELLRVLIEAEITARDQASHARNAHQSIRVWPVCCSPACQTL